jgi:hypothetical protein
VKTEPKFSEKFKEMSLEDLEAARNMTAKRQKELESLLQMDNENSRLGRNLLKLMKDDEKQTQVIV